MAEKVYFSLEDGSITYFLLKKKKKKSFLKEATSFFAHPVKDVRVSQRQDLLQWHVRYPAELVLKSCAMGLLI